MHSIETLLKMDHVPTCSCRGSRGAHEIHCARYSGTDQGFSSLRDARLEILREELNRLRTKNMTRLKYIFIVFIGLTIMLMGLFLLKIKHNNSIDAIFDKYYIEMEKIKPINRELK